MSAAAPALELAAAEIGHAGFVLEIEALTLRRGEAVALFGPSGAGKSTLLDLLALARPPARAARFAILPRAGPPLDIAALWARGADAALSAARARHTGYVLQQGGLLPFLDVRRNIGLPCELLGIPPGPAIAPLAAALDITPLLGRMPATLSVGQRQRVAIARALAHAPDLVLADEPTASVHPGMADAVMTLLREGARQAGAALLLATHDPDRAARHGFRMLGIETAEGFARSRLAAAP